MASDSGPRMTLPTQLVLRAMLAEPTQEMYGLQIGQVAELPVDAGDDHVPVVGVQVAGGSPRRHLALTPLSLAVEHLDLDLGHGFASRGRRDRMR